MPTMPESINQMPFVCKWLYSHPEPQQFKTQEELKNHIDKHDINSCNGSSLEDPIYICPWEGCNKRQSSIIKLEEHLYRHIRQRPFKCPICTGSRFCSPDALNRHLIINHNDNIVDSDTDNDTLCDENEKLNLGKTEDKNDARVKKEYSKDPISNTTKLSYCDVLVTGCTSEAAMTGRAERKSKSKGTVNENNDEGNLAQELERLGIGRPPENYEYEKTVWDLICKGLEAISLQPESPGSEYDFDNENYDDLPNAPRGKLLSEVEQDNLMWETLCEAYKDTEAGKYFNEASEMMAAGLR